jgi:glucose/arabinose dehydrogenase
MLQAGEVKTTQFLCHHEAPPLRKQGLDERLPNANCLAPASSHSEGVTTRPAFPKLRFQSPVAMVQPPHDASRWYVVEQRGQVHVFDNNDNVETGTLALDISDQVYLGYEPGLLGLAFHPGWPLKKEVYLFYTTLRGVDPSYGVRSVVSRFRTLPGNELLFDEASEEEVLSIQKSHEEHNGGGIAFDENGYLVIGVGDGRDWPPALAQDSTSLAGKFLRIDVDHPDPLLGTAYSIPRDNPFVDAPGVRPEILASGFRNPWRWSFDSLTGEIYAGDVGLLTYEEVNHVLPGRDYGWPTIEGDRCRVNDWTDTVSCDVQASAPPLTMYKNAMGCSITGGYVYRGTGIPNLKGFYLYGDFCNGRVWGYDVDGKPAHHSFVTDTPMNISSFAQDHDGEVYVLDWWTGRIERFVATPRDAMPERLSATGCVDPDNPANPLPQAIPYAVNAPFFSETGVYKRRWFFLPDEKTIFVSDGGEWSFPVGSVLMKAFYVGDDLFEVRLMTHSDDGWSGWSYRWDEQLGDGVRVDFATEATLPDGRPWLYPDRGQCLHCHTSPSNFVLGPETRQLNGPSYYASTDRWSNQLDTLRALGMLRNVGAAPAADLERLPYPHDADAPLDERARAYLHTNCSQCHQPGGGGYGLADFRWETPFAEMNICGQSAWSSTFGIPNARLLVPGNPERSLVYQRMAREDVYAMHPYRLSVDEPGLRLIGDWIESIGSCPQ